MPNLLFLIILLGCSIWVLLYAYLIFATHRLPRFERFGVYRLENWPHLSVIVPACNEARQLESAVNTLLAQDYPNLEIILVNDRSTDETGKIVDKLAVTDPRIKPIHIHYLPKCWLGKVHAIHQGWKQARGEWLLITDADVYYAEGVLKRAMTYCMREDIDHLALMPNVKSIGYWLDVVVSTFGMLFLFSVRATQINKPDSKAFIGIGAFNLVKRETLDKTPGFEWLRLEVVDDVGLGYMIKKAGGQAHLALAYKDISLIWYESIGAMFYGLEKNLFGAAAGFCWWKSVLKVFFLWLFLVSPIIALLSSNPVLFSTGIGVACMHMLFNFACARDEQTKSSKLLMFPVGIALLSLMMLWSTYRSIKNDGVNWRDTHYSLDALRNGRRVKF